MALFFICHLSSVISVINNKTPERFGSVGNNAYICRQKRKYTAYEQSDKGMKI